jgi:hypothetical protein
MSIAQDAGHMSRIFNIMPEDPHANAPIPGIPSGLSGVSVPSGNGVTLTWSASSEATGYAIYRHDNGDWRLLAVTDEYQHRACGWQSVSVLCAGVVEW